MAGYADHRDALKPQNMNTEQRIENIKKRKKSLNGIQENKIFPDGDTSLLDNFQIMMHGNTIEKKLGRPLSYASVEEFDHQIGEYVQYCLDKQIVPTRPSLALWLGLDSGTLATWKNDSTNPFAESIKKTEELFHSFLLQKTTEGKINTILYFFLAKNWYGMSDKTEIVHKSQSTQVIDISEQQRILRSTPGVVVDADFEDLGTEDLGVQTSVPTALAEGENLATQSVSEPLRASEDLATSENLETLLVGAENLAVHSESVRASAGAENLDTHTDWSEDL